MYMLSPKQSVLLSTVIRAKFSHWSRGEKKKKLDWNNAVVDKWQLRI